MKTTHKTRVLVTDAQIMKTLGIVRALGDSVEAMTASHSRTAIAAWSKYARRHFVHPEDDSRQFADWVLDICLKHGVSAVITPDDQSSFLIARKRDAFEAEHITLTVPDVKTLTLAMDKSLTIEMAQQLGVPVPPTRILKDFSEAVPAARELGYPVVIKPRQSYHWTGTRFIATDSARYADSDERLLAALKSLPSEIPPPILQAYVPGRGVGVSMLIGPNGALCAEFSHERLRDTKPTGSGSCLRRSIPMDEKLRNMSLRLLRQLNWWGVAMVEFRVDDSRNCPYLMEINGRFWGSVQLAIDAGVNFPRLLLDLAHGKPVVSPAYDTNTILRWWLGDARRTLRIFRGRPAGFTGEFPGRLSSLKELLGRQPAGTRNQVFRWDDPWPALGELFALVWR